MGGNDIRVIKDGTGTLTLAGSNSYQGTTTITQGRLQMGASNVLPNSSNVVLAGGTLATGGNSDTVGTLAVSASSVMDMGLGASQLTFASISSWTAPLQVWNWTGTIDTAGGTDRLLFASTATGPGPVQFYSNFGTTAIGSGGAFVGNELVPVPEPGAVFAALLLLAPVAWRERRSFMRVRG